MLLACAALAASVTIPRAEDAANTREAWKEAPGTLKVTLTDQDGQPAATRVHLRDAAGQDVLPPGEPAQLKWVYKGDKALTTDWFYAQGYNRAFVKLDGPFSAENWVAGLKAGRSFVTNRPLLLATIDGKQSGAELAVDSRQSRPLQVDIRVVSATSISRIDILRNGKVLRQLDVDPPAGEVHRTEAVTVTGSGWLAVRYTGRGSNINLEPRFALGHTSPWYVLVEGRPIRSPQDAAYFYEQFSGFTKLALPTVTNPDIRKALETRCQQALEVFARQRDRADTKTDTK